MEKYCILVFLLILSCSIKNTGQNSEWQISSPDKKINARIQLRDSGQMTYQVFSKTDTVKTEIIETSQLGIIREDQGFDSLKIISVSDIRTFDQTYTRRTGKRLKNRNHYDEITLNLENIAGSKLDVVFRAYNDGIAFKYVFPEEDEKEYSVLKEITGFNLPEEGLAWLQPYDTTFVAGPAYERNFMGKMPIGTVAPDEDGWCFPALFEVKKHWLLVTEANLKDNFYGSHLNAEAKDGLYTIRPPEDDELFGYGNAKAVSDLPWDMPWRVIIISDSLGDIVSSNLVSHVSEPSKIEDASWVVPGRASWTWWSSVMDGSRDTPKKLKKFIDFAQTMGWEYSLLDGGWDTVEGLDLEEIIDYADKRGVKLLLWYNSGGPMNTIVEGRQADLMYYPEMRMEEMRRISELGIKGIKIDFFDSDKQVIIKLYMDILRDALKHKLMVDFHGSTMPRGWSRTYPNLVSMESVKGSEGYIFHADFEDNAPRHNTILPFTRNVVGSMDYTPVAFSKQKYLHRTSYGHELAQSVVFESGIQHFPDKVDVYLRLSEEVLGFLKDVPAAWEETHLVSGYPGNEVVIARKKNDSTWFVGGMNGENEEKVLKVDFSFLEEGDYEALIIQDGKNNTSLSTSKKTITNNSIQTVKVLPFGGFVMKFSKKQ